MIPKKSIKKKFVYKVWTNGNKAWIKKDALQSPGLDPFNGEKEEYLEANGLDDVTMSDEYPDDGMGMEFNEELTAALNDVSEAQIRLYSLCASRGDMQPMGMDKSKRVKGRRNKSDVQFQYEDSETGKKETSRGKVEEIDVDSLDTETKDRIKYRQQQEARRRLEAKSKFHANTLEDNEARNKPHQDLGPVATRRSLSILTKLASIRDTVSKGRIPVTGLRLLKSDIRRLLRSKSDTGAEEFLRHMLEQELEEVDEIKAFLEEDVPAEAEEAMKSCENRIVRRALSKLASKQKAMVAPYYGPDEGEDYRSYRRRMDIVADPAGNHGYVVTNQHGQNVTQDGIFINQSDAEKAIRYVYDTYADGKPRKSIRRKGHNEGGWVVIGEDKRPIVTACSQADAQRHQDNGVGTAMSIQDWTNKRLKSKRRNKDMDDMANRYEDAQARLQDIRFKIEEIGMDMEGTPYADKINTLMDSISDVEQELAQEMMPAKSIRKSKGGTVTISDNGDPYGLGFTGSLDEGKGSFHLGDVGARDLAFWVNYCKRNGYDLEYAHGDLSDAEAQDAKDNEKGGEDEVEYDKSLRQKRKGTQTEEENDVTRQANRSSRAKPVRVRRESNHGKEMKKGLKADGSPGFDGYAYSADIYCPQCGGDIIDNLDMSALQSGDDRDSEIVPQPIFFGESDHPEHCANCGEYMYGDKEIEEDEEETEENKSATMPDEAIEKNEMMDESTTPAEGEEVVQQSFSKSARDTFAKSVASLGKSVSRCDEVMYKTLGV